MPNWQNITSEDHVDDALRSSHTAPVVIFKHSTTCPISSIAKSRVESNWSDWATAEWYHLDLLRYRSVSNYIAERLQVHHESPQAIVIHQGEVMYDSSHLDISVDDLKSSVPSLS